MKRNIQVRIVMSEDERAKLEKGAAIRRRSFADYIRWLISVDEESRYRLTDIGRAALDEAEKK